MLLCCCEIPLSMFSKNMYRRTSPTVVHFIASINDFPFIMWLCNFHHLFPWNLRIFGFLQESWVSSNQTNWFASYILKHQSFTSPTFLAQFVSMFPTPSTSHQTEWPCHPSTWCIMMPRPSTKGATHKGWGKEWGCYLWMRGGSIHRENAGTLGWYPSCLSPTRSPLEGDIPNRYPLYKVYMGLIIKGTIPRVPPFSPWSMRCDSQWFIPCPAKPEKLQHWKHLKHPWRIHGTFVYLPTIIIKTN